MLQHPLITVEENRYEEERPWTDFTPEDRRTFQRVVRLEAGEPGTVSGIRLELAEHDRSEPDYLHLALYIDQPAGYDREVSLEGTLSVEQLDAVIEALTLARDAAICEWMIAPAGGVR